MFILDRALKSGIAGEISGLSEEELKTATVTLKNATNQMSVAQPYRLEGRDRFHFVTRQGRYTIEVKAGQNVQTKTVVVRDTLERVTVGDDQ